MTAGWAFLGFFNLKAIFELFLYHDITSIGSTEGTNFRRLLMIFKPN